MAGVYNSDTLLVQSNSDTPNPDRSIQTNSYIVRSDSIMTRNPSRFVGYLLCKVSLGASLKHEQKLNCYKEIGRDYWLISQFPSKKLVKWLVPGGHFSKLQTTS